MRTSLGSVVDESSPSGRREGGCRPLLVSLVLLLLVGCGAGEPPPARGTPDASVPAPSGTSVPAPPPVALPAPGARTPARPAEPVSAKAAAATQIEGSTSRWYEVRSQGQKLGSVHVVWAPSTWQGKKTVRDTTTQRTREGRQMLGTEDVFEDETVSEVERGEDGTLWWLRSVKTEAGGRATVSETTWTGDGYESVTRLAGQEERHVVKTTTPVHVDAEAFAGAHVRDGTAVVGAKLVLRQADVRAGKVLEIPVEVIGTETVEGEAGPVACTKLRETSPEDGTITTWWLDAQGVVVRFKQMTLEIRRAAESVARTRPVRTASFSITTPATPHLPRIFSAERVLLDLHLQGDPDRPLPEPPVSPWSRVTSVAGSDAEGFVLRCELTAYDAPDAKAVIPVRDPAFAKDLEPTVLMPCLHPDVKAAAERAVAGETDARRAVERIADFVYTLEKQSPDVAEATALEILKDRRGDCSEHALLFVALCRAAGIPARRCSGYVCVGDDWGSHAWAEVWTGAWMGVDPTTNDVGTAARYLFFGYSDDPSSRPGTVSARARGRMRFVTVHLEEGDDHVDLTDADALRRFDPETGRAVHALAGIDVRGLPKEASVILRGDSEVRITIPEGTITLQAQADQGQRGPAFLRRLGGETATFAGKPALVQSMGSRAQILVWSRRRIVSVGLRPRGELAALRRAAETLLAATFTDRPQAPPPPAPAAPAAPDTPPK